MWLIEILAVLILLLFYLGMRLFRKAVVQDTAPTPEEILDRWEHAYGGELTIVREGMAWFRAQKTEELAIYSFDGLRLKGAYLPAEGPSRGRILLFHGYRSCGLMDFSGAMRFYHEAGYDLLLADQRAHGRSEGRFIGFGILERRDLRAWTEELNRRFGGDEPTFLAGISMGASTVLMAAGGELPDNTRGIIADCGFTSPKDIVVHELHALLHLPKYPLLPLVDLLCRLLAGYGFGDYSTLTAMETNTLPVFFIHGGGDNFVPTEMTRLNYAACRAEKRLLIVPGADHGMSWLEDPESYQRELSDFLARYGSARNSA